MARLGNLKCGCFLTLKKRLVAIKFWSSSLPDTLASLDATLMLAHTRTITDMTTTPSSDSQQTALEGLFGFIELDLLHLLLLWLLK